MGRRQKYPVTSLSPESFAAVKSPTADLNLKFGPHFATTNGEILETRNYPNQSRVLKKIIADNETSVYQISQYSSWPDDERMMHRCVKGDLSISDMVAYRFCEGLNKIIAQKYGKSRPQLTIVDVIAGRILDKTPKEPKIAMINT
jgi:hypothetical protein